MEKGIVEGRVNEDQEVGQKARHGKDEVGGWEWKVVKESVVELHARYGRETGTTSVFRNSLLFIN